MAPLTALRRLTSNATLAIGRWTVSEVAAAADNHRGPGASGRTPGGQPLDAAQSTLRSPSPSLASSDIGPGNSGQQ